MSLTDEQKKKMEEWDKILEKDDIPGLQKAYVNLIKEFYKKLSKV